MRHCTPISLLAASLVMSACSTSAGPSTQAGTPDGAPEVTTGIGEPPTRPPKGACSLDDPAFCETFDTVSPGGRGGDLDERIWGVSRWTHEGGDMFSRPPASSEPTEGVGLGYPDSTFCGESFNNVGIGEDMRICDGQLNELMHDGNDFSVNSMMIRQPFDFEGRTGRITMDVDAKANPQAGGHGWWVEIWVSQEPQPVPYQDAPSVHSLPRNAVGFMLDASGAACAGGHAWDNSMVRYVVTREHEIAHDVTGSNVYDDCFYAEDRVLNHLEIRLSQSTLELWASDAGAPESFRRVAVVHDLDLNFSRGFVSLQHSQYNAGKDGAAHGQAYRWDNIGFDGPSLARLVAYEVPDAGSRVFGYDLDEAPCFDLEGLDLEGAEAALLDLSWINQISTSDPLRYALNGGDWHEFTWDSDFLSEGVTGWSLPIPIEELNQGGNRLCFDRGSSYQMIGNIDITLTGAPQ